VKVAVLSDIHCNCFALRAVLDEMTAENPDAVIVLGDTFGYYPWALETYRTVRDLQPVAILGNHDKLLLDADPQPSIQPHWEIVKHNENQLAAEPTAIDWLRGLSPKRELTIEGRHVLCCHGTPDNPLNGRYYPDRPEEPPWRLGPNDILLMGHTHYPLVRTTMDGGLIANPGSVGQPRDGDLRASWGLFFPLERRFEVRRTPYDVDRTIKMLEEMGWYQLAINALRKDYRGPLR
jgi:putative phosphoesterase